MVPTEIACTDIVIQQRENNNKIKFDLYCRIYMDNLRYYGFLEPPLINLLSVCQHLEKPSQSAAAQSCKTWVLGYFNARNRLTRSFTLQRLLLALQNVYN